MTRKDGAYHALKWTLAGVFIWFGLLKFFDVSPVKDLVFAATPFIKTIPFGFTGLALFEVLAGLALLFRKTAFVAAVLIMVHLSIATIAVLFLPVVWESHFPFLSVEGEFALKNVVFIAAAWAIAKMERSV